MKCDVIFQDENFIVTNKPYGISSQKSTSVNMVDVLKECLSLKTEPYVVHRLDTAVGGLMVYAKNKKTAAYLSKQITSGDFKKTYLCVVHSCPDETEGTMTDYLFKDSKKNKSFVVKSMRKGVKEAVLNYKNLESIQLENEKFSLIEVNLITGRTHQIRVQFSSRTMPLYGDGKYGGKDNGKLALFSHKLEFKDYDNNTLSFENFPSQYPFNMFKNNKE